MPLDEQSMTQKYEQIEPVLERGLLNLEKIVNDALGEIEDINLVRAYIDEGRKKELTSCARKANNNNLSPEDLFDGIHDMVGVRVVCNNISDVYRFLKIFEETLGPIPEAIKQDYIKEPATNGYRAIHINFPLEVSVSGLPAQQIWCELQVRSRIQDSWAKLMHYDIYKNEAELPPDLVERAQDLADVLAACDGNAQKIRYRAVEFEVAEQTRGIQKTATTTPIPESKIRQEIPVDVVELWERTIWLAGNFREIWPGGEAQKRPEVYMARCEEYSQFIDKHTKSLKSAILDKAQMLYGAIGEYKAGKDLRWTPPYDVERSREGGKMMTAGAKKFNQAISELRQAIRAAYGVE